jgi:hypothetical protein
MGRCERPGKLGRSKQRPYGPLLSLAFLWTTSARRGYGGHGMPCPYGCFVCGFLRGIIFFVLLRFFLRLPLLLRCRGRGLVRGTFARR